MQSVIDFLLDCFSVVYDALFHKLSFTVFSQRISLGSFMLAILIMTLLFKIFLPILTNAPGDVSVKNHSSERIK